MLKYPFVLLLTLISCQAFSQEKIEIVFNIQGVNNSKTWGKPKESDFVSETITQTDKNYYDKEIINTLRADIKSKYGDFSIVLFDYNKNGTFNDFRTLGSKIGSDGIEVCNYKSFEPNKHKPSRVSIYKDHPIIINSVGFRIKNLRKNDANSYKADLVKEDINPKEVIKNRSGILNDHLFNVQLISYNDKDTLQLHSFLNNGKYLFLNNFKYSNRLYNARVLNKYKFLIDNVDIDFNKEKSNIGLNTNKSRPGYYIYDTKKTSVKNNDAIYFVQNTDYNKIVKLGFNNNFPNGILIDDQGKVLFSNVSTTFVINYLKKITGKTRATKNTSQQNQTDQKSLSLFYEIGKYKLSKENNSKINQFLKTLDTTATYMVKIVSSADYLGTSESNFTLAKNRAKEIKHLLNNTYSKLFTHIKSVNKGEISETKKENTNTTIGNIKNRKTSIVFIKNEIQKKKQPLSTEKKVYIYNPRKQEFELEVGRKFILKRLIFNRGTSIMQQRSKSSLKGLLRFLKENPSVEIEIQGHLCCNAGKYQPDSSKVVPYHEGDLSSKRARLVYKYLVKNRIRSKRLTYNGYGFQTPIHYPETSQKEKSINKRVEIVITKI